MRSDTESLLLDEVAPRLRSALPKQMPMVGGDDPEELVQDGLAIAFQLHVRAKAAGKTVTPGNLAFYTLRLLRAGRRSTGYRKNDVLHPAAQLLGHSRVSSLDEPVREPEHGEEPLTLHDCLAGPAEDPATVAGRRLDWTEVLASIDRTAKAILEALAEGRELTLLVQPLKRSRSSLQTDKMRLGQAIQDLLGSDILQQAQARPGWTCTLEAVRERLACRAERRAA